MSSGEREGEKKGGRKKGVREGGKWKRVYVIGIEYQEHGIYHEGGQ